jgi:hypothetical protein
LKWGADDEAMLRRSGRKQEFEAAAEMLRLARAGTD